MDGSSYLEQLADNRFDSSRDEIYELIKLWQRNPDLTPDIPEEELQSRILNLCTTYSGSSEATKEFLGAAIANEYEVMAQLLVESDNELLNLDVLLGFIFQTVFVDMDVAGVDGWKLRLSPGMAKLEGELVYQEERFKWLEGQFEVSQDGE